MGRDELARRIAEVPVRYRTLELAAGIATPGYFAVRPFVPEFRSPASSMQQVRLWLAERARDSHAQRLVGTS